jgi:aldehyde dehydrogenase
MEMEETKVGRLDHKILKLTNMRFVLGVEAMRSDARSDSTGLCIIERAPWGVIGMMLPVTHSVPTMASNAINILAAGNTAVFGPHPSGAKVAQYALQLFNREIERELGVANVLTTVREASIEAAEQIFIIPRSRCCASPAARRWHRQPQIRQARDCGRPRQSSGRRRRDRRSGSRRRCIIEGAAFDNNLLCIGEKEIFVVASVADKFIAAMRRAGAFQLDPRPSSGSPRPPSPLRAAVGLRPGACQEGFRGQGCRGAGGGGGRARAGQHATSLWRDRREPCLRRGRADDALHPVVRVRDVDAAIAASVKAEHGYRHTAIIHTQEC